MKRLFLCSALAISPLLMGIQGEISPEEGFFLKRVTEFWKDRDYALVEGQIAKFLAEHPETRVADQLHAILGDLRVQEKRFEEALASYRAIVGEEWQEKTLVGQAYALHELQRFDDILLFLGPKVVNAKEEVKVIVANAALKKAKISTDVQVQKRLAAQAKEILLSLGNPPKDAQVGSLIEAHTILGEQKEAAILFALLAEKQGEGREEFLFQTAFVQSSFDKVAAISTYEQVVQMNGPHAREAAYNQLLLMVDAGQFTELLEKKEAIGRHLSEEQMPLLKFCVGKSLFSLGKYTEATPLLSGVTGPFRAPALLMTVAAAHAEHNIALMNEAVQRLLDEYPTDSETAKALLMRAKMASQDGLFEGAIADLERLSQQFPAFEEKKEVMYERASLLFRSQQWEKSRTAFFSLLAEFPDMQEDPAILRSIVECSRQVSILFPERSDLFVSDVFLGLDREGTFSAEEMPALEFLIGRALLDGGKNTEAASHFEQFLSRYPSHPLAGDVHLMAAIALRSTDERRFTEHATLALEQGIEVDRAALHIELFNAFLTLKDWDRAAHHLYEAAIVERSPIAPENALWLANYYHQKHDTDRAVPLFKKVLGVEANFAALAIDDAHLFLEAEAVKLSRLLSVEEKVVLLKTLTRLQRQAPAKGWKLRRQALFDLASAYVQNGLLEEALAQYEELIGSSRHSASYFATAARLQRARILYHFIPSEEKVDGHPKMIDILSALKDLQIQKRAYSEPMHLEAALDYADLRASLVPPERKAEMALFFLRRLQDDFTNQENDDVREYHEAQRRIPEKAALFAQYLKCVGAEIAKYEARLNGQETETALVRLRELGQEKGLSIYLSKRIARQLNHTDPTVCSLEDWEPSLSDSSNLLEDVP
jgi:tetratricopeptide (TPR) repeat protein